MPPQKIQFRDWCREAGVVDADTCAKEIEKKIGPQIQKAIDEFKTAEQKHLSDATKAMPPQAACMSLWEYRMFLNLNRDRIQHHLPPLQVDCDLVTTARNHSFDMALRDYVEHTTPEGVKAGDRMFSATGRFFCVAENLAMSNGYGWEKVSEEAEKQLMNSPGHRANILNPLITHVGIAIFKGQDRKLYTTQNFGSTNHDCIAAMKKEKH